MTKEVKETFAHTGAILAGGQSKRMGRPKERILLWDGRSMIEHVMRPLATFCKQVVIVGGAPDLLPTCPHLVDPYPYEGPLSGIATLLESNLDDRYIVVACDQPFLQPALFELLEKEECPSIFLGDTGEMFDPFPGYFPATLLPEIQKSIKTGERSLCAFIRQIEVAWIPLPSALRGCLKSINTPFDLMNDKREPTTQLLRGF